MKKINNTVAVNVETVIAPPAMSHRDALIMQMLGGDDKIKAEAKEITDNGGRASAGQMKFYNDLCIQKQVMVDEACVTAVGVSDAIKHLMTMPTFKPLSEKQVSKITEYCTELGMPLPDFSKLSGAFDGSGSKFIGQLIEMSKNKIKPASDAQKEFILQMSVCPDCEDITDRIDSIDSKSASEFITVNRVKYFEWKNTRLSPAQMNLIVSLTERTGGEPLSLTQIIQFDKPFASKYIEQLQRELKDKSLIATTLEPEFECLDNKDVTEEIRDLVHRMYATVGQEVEDEFLETLNFDKLKDLCGLLKVYSIPVADMLIDSGLFDDAQVEALTI
jgi:hypothetical protein